MEEAGLSESPEAILEACDFSFLENGTEPKVLEKMLRNLAEVAVDFDEVTRATVREALIARLTVAGRGSPAKLADAALGRTKQPVKKGQVDVTEDPLPAAEHPVEGAELLTEIKNWLRRYVFASESAITAVAIWAVCTWFVDRVYFAPILAILSPTKRAGKSLLLLDLLRWIVRRPLPTSGVGITPAVVFRLASINQPTFLVDEAEKLAHAKNGSSELIGLLNAGYRRGNKVYRCNKEDGEITVEEFDAFGFRAVAAIGRLWDTLIDRSVVIPIERKPPGEVVSRLQGRKVEKEGKLLAQRIRRFAEDHLEVYAEHEKVAPRPEWLNDRACDNWSSLFVVAHLVGKDWPTLALESAKDLSRSQDDGDRAELLVHDVRQAFLDEGWPDVIKSGDLAATLNALEGSPWGEFNKGKGVTTHRLAALFKSFKIGPKQDRDSLGAKVRGYWLQDLKEAFSRYRPPSELGQVGQPNNGAGLRGFQTGTNTNSCPTSESAESLINTGLSQLSHSEPPSPGGGDEPERI